MATVGIPELVARLLDPRQPFDLYFCVQERGLPRWSIAHPRRTPYHLLYVPDSDPLVGEVDGVRVRVDPGSMLWVQPETVFQLAALGSAAGISLGVCRFELADRPVLRLPEPFRLGRRPDREAPLEDLLPGRELGDGLDQLHRRAVLARLLCRGFAEDGAAGDGEGLTPDQRARLLAFMTARIRGRFGLRELARVVELNPQYLSRRFARAFGAAPRAFIVGMRIRHAAGYLRASDAGIAATAERFGYASGFLFSRQFRQVMGCSPSAWRKRR